MSITAKQVAELRGQTGAGLMDCKKALTESEGDLEKAITILRKKGMASASKKAGRATSEGLIESYIHLGGKVGVLIEVNCETDFVAKTDDFKSFVKDLCLHVAAVNPICISRDEVPADLLEKEREIAASQAEGKPPAAVQKIVEGKLNKYFATACLLDQPFVKDGEKSVQDILNEQISKLGENMQINRFSRFQIGEESEDWSIFLALILKSDPGTGVAFFRPADSSTLLGVSLNVGCKKAGIFPAGFRVKVYRPRDEADILFLKCERSVGFEVISKSFFRCRILKLERDT